MNVDQIRRIWTQPSSYDQSSNKFKPFIYCTDLPGISATVALYFVNNTWAPFWDGKVIWLLYSKRMFKLSCIRVERRILVVFLRRDVLTVTKINFVNTLRTGDADLRFYITTVQDGWRKFAFLTRACFPCTIHLIMPYIEPVSEWSCWRMFIETWPHSELNFRHRASSI